MNKTAQFLLKLLFGTARITKGIVIGGVVTTLLLLPYYYFAFTSPDVISVKEIRWHLWGDIALKAVAVFGILRMYNAIVMHTTFTIKLNQQMKLVEQQAKETVAESKKEYAAHAALKKSLDSLNTTIQVSDKSKQPK